MNNKLKNNIVFCFLFFVFCFLTYFWQGIYLPKFSYSSEKVIFSVKKGQNLFLIAKNLEKEGLIQNRFLFDVHVFLKGDQRKLQAGEYELNPSFSTSKIAQKIISGDIAKITITIPEGWTQKQIEETLNLKLPGENLEGFLFPDTYQFPAKISGEEVVEKMRENFDKKLTPELREEIKRQGKTIFEIVTMASLIEKEVKTKEDKEMISGILWKRLEIGMPLQVDAALDTYKYKGLPPAPICNPGLESIKAAIYPKDSEYWYYLSPPEGETIFSKTLEEHNLAKAKYLK